MKTIKEWLEELPEEYKYRAIANYDPNFSSSRKVETVQSPLDALNHAFNWFDSKEGEDYWLAVCEGRPAELPIKTQLSKAEENASFWERECRQMEENYQDEKIARKELVEALEAIKARMDGERDNPLLLKYDALSININEDIMKIIKQSLEPYTE